MPRRSSKTVTRSSAAAASSAATSTATNQDTDETSDKKNPQVSSNVRGSRQRKAAAVVSSPAQTTNLDLSPLQQGGRRQKRRTTRSSSTAVNHKYLESDLGLHSVTKKLNDRVNVEKVCTQDIQREEETYVKEEVSLPSIRKKMVRRTRSLSEPRIKCNSNGTLQKSSKEDEKKPPVIEDMSDDTGKDKSRCLNPDDEEKNKVILPNIGNKTRNLIGLGEKPTNDMMLSTPKGAPEVLTNQNSINKFDIPAVVEDGGTEVDSKLLSSLRDPKEKIEETRKVQQLPMVRHTVCVVCEKDDDPALTILLCDGVDCNKEYHITCLSPPLDAIPEGEWFCPDCSSPRKTRSKKKIKDNLGGNDTNKHVDNETIMPTKLRVRSRQKDNVSKEKDNPPATKKNSKNFLENYQAYQWRFLSARKTKSAGQVTVRIVCGEAYDVPTDYRSNESDDHSLGTRTEDDKDGTVLSLNSLTKNTGRGKKGIRVNLETTKVVSEDNDNDVRHPSSTSSNRRGVPRRGAAIMAAATLKINSKTDEEVSTNASREKVPHNQSNSVTLSLKQESMSIKAENDVGEKKRVLPIGDDNDLELKKLDTAKEESEKVINSSLRNVDKPCEHEKSKKKEGVSAEILGDDGNRFYCTICHDVGDVVCCDGCPNVYHPTCVPIGSQSRGSLDNDDDPWYCPACFDHSGREKRQGTKRNFGGRSKRRLISKQIPSLSLHDKKKEKRAICSLCTKNRGEMVPCRACGVEFHLLCMSEAKHLGPSTLSLNAKKDDLCNTCAQLEADTDKIETKRQKVATTPLTITENTGNDIRDNNSENKSIDANRDINGHDDVLSLQSGRGSKKLKKKSPHKKRKRNQQTSRFNQHGRSNADEIHSYSRPVKATPAFFFFLSENRKKIEKALGKCFSHFNNCPKGLERNCMIAKEGSKWWGKRSGLEKFHWTNIAMADFEDRVKEWKLKNPTSLLATIESPTVESPIIESPIIGSPKIIADHVVSNDAKLLEVTKDEPMNEITNDTGQTMLSGSSETCFYPKLSSICHCIKDHKQFATECKQQKSQSNDNSNQVFLELLNDCRLHPIPMVRLIRTNEDVEYQDNANRVLPAFDVEGPVSTSVGDECIGCGRGWCHFCPVLKKKFPAVESRAKLQPPLSSLHATRIGLGISDPDSCKHGKNLPLMQSHQRGDKVLQFLENAISTKLVHPIIDKNGDGHLPQDSTLLEGGITENKRSKTTFQCQCGKITFSSRGCIKCQRDSLADYFSQRLVTTTTTELELQKTDGASLQKIQSVMLGRAPLPFCNFKRQLKGERAVVAAMIQRQWKPNTVMPLCFPNLSVRPALPCKVAGNENHDPFYNYRSRLQISGYSFDNNVINGDTRGASHDNIDAEGFFDKASKHGTRRRRRTSIGNDSNKYLDNTDPLVELRRATRKSSPEFAGECIEYRQEISDAHRNEINSLQQKCLMVACCGMLLGLMRRDPLRLFAHSIPSNNAMHQTVKTQPIDFSIIRTRVLSRHYSTLTEFISDMKLLCASAIDSHPSNSIYWSTAKDISDVLKVMHRRASDWMSVIKNAHAVTISGHGRRHKKRRKKHGKKKDRDDPFSNLRKFWPGAVELLNDEHWLIAQLETNFARTKENELSYYASVAIRRAATVAVVSAAPKHWGGIHSPCVMRSAGDDESLREFIDKQVSRLCDSVPFNDESRSKEESILRTLKQTQISRMERQTLSKSGCARCDDTFIRDDHKVEVIRAIGKIGQNIFGGKPRLVAARKMFNTGLGARKIESGAVNDSSCTEQQVSEVCGKDLSVCLSPIHGWGLFNDRPFAMDEVVAEYVGEYITNSVACHRENIYQKERRKAYQFRIDSNFVIDATMKGNCARFINHCCNPNCVTKVHQYDSPSLGLKKVTIIAKRDIKGREEITYDYQLPLEPDSKARIPCNCGSVSCRGLMNWNLVEKIRECLPFGKESGIEQRGDTCDN